MQIAPFFLPVAQHSLHAVGKELLPQYKQLYDYILRGGAAALPLSFVLVSRKISIYLLISLFKIKTYAQKRKLILFSFV